MKIFIKSGAIALFLLVNTALQAAENKYEQLQQMMSKTFPGMEVGGFKASGMPGLLQFSMGAQTLYVTEDGRFLFQGDLYDLVSQKNLTEETEKSNRVGTLETFGEENMLVFKPKEQKNFITVFTDVDCPYCRRFHEEMDQYLAKGIAVRYIFLPFKGQKSLEQSVNIWCAKNPQEAMTTVKNGNRITSPPCNNPIQKHMELGKNFSIRGTPAIVLQDGELIPGYRPVSDVAKMLGQQ